MLHSWEYPASEMDCCFHEVHGVVLAGDKGVHGVLQCGEMLRVRACYLLTIFI